MVPETPARPTDRLFFAVYPDAQAADEIARLAHALRAEQGLRGAPLKPERFHLTLHYLGDHVGLPHELVAAASRAAASISAPPFEISLDRVASFSRRARNRPCVLRGEQGTAAVAAFQQTLGAALAQAGLGRWVDKGFVPHATLLYDDRLVPMQVVDAITWTVCEFLLVDSRIGQSRHVPLARWPLVARGLQAL
jgi:2'-5' RNA ligase